MAGSCSATRSKNMLQNEQTAQQRKVKTLDRIKLPGNAASSPAADALKRFCSLLFSYTARGPSFNAGGSGYPLGNAVRKPSGASTPGGALTV